MAQVCIYNQLGALIMKQEEALKHGQNNWQLNLSAFPTGAYILNVQTSEQHYVKRLMVVD